MESHHHKPPSTSKDRPPPFPTSGTVSISGSSEWSFGWNTFWMILLLITAAFVCAFLVRFIAEPAVTTTQITELNGGLRLPNFTVCIYGKLPELNHDFFGLSGYSDYDSIVMDPHKQQYHNATLRKEVQDALNKLNTSEKLLQDRWDYILLPLGHRYFSFLFFSEQQDAVDYLDQSSLDPYLNQWSPSVTFMGMLWRNNLDLPKVTELFVEHALGLNVTLKALFDKYSRELATFYGLYVWSGHYSGAINTRLSWLGSWGSNKTSCFDVRLFDRLRSNDVYVYATTHFVAEQVKTYVGLNSSHAVAMYVNDSQMALFFDTVPLNNKGKFPDLRVFFGEDKKGVLSIGAEYKLIENCSPEMSKKQCDSFCRQETIEKVCGCVPLSSLSHKANCTASQYLDCLKYNASKEYICRHACPPLCRTVIFSMKDTQVVGNSRWDMRAHIELDERHFPLFEQVYVHSWVTFLANLGGLANLLIGASLFGLLQLICRAILPVFGRYSAPTKRKKKKTTLEIKDELPNGHCTACDEQANFLGLDLGYIDDDCMNRHETMSIRLGQLEERLRVVEKMPPVKSRSMPMTQAQLSRDPF